MYGSTPIVVIHFSGANSFPLDVTANGNLNEDSQLQTKKRSQSEILPPRIRCQEVCSTSSDFDNERYSTVQGVVGRALSREGLFVEDDDAIVRVVEQEIAEAFDVSSGQLNEAAARLLTELETSLGSDNEADKVDYPVIKSDDESDSDRPSHFWREGLKGIPDSCIVITDL